MRKVKEIAKVCSAKIKNFARNVSLGMAMGTLMVSNASASSFTGDTVTVSTKDVNAGALMGQIIGILLTITRYVGVALVIYGIYEIVMSFMQNQPEAKTKGIVMALAGVVMIGLKSILKGLGVVS